VAGFSLFNHQTSWGMKTLFQVDKLSTSNDEPENGLGALEHGLISQEFILDFRDVFS
jgi:hypothetical protein